MLDSEKNSKTTFSVVVVAKSWTGVPIDTLLSWYDTVYSKRLSYSDNILTVILNRNLRAIGRYVIPKNHDSKNQTR